MKLNLFGSFSLSNGDVVLDEQRIHSKKLMCLITYLIINRDAPVTRGNLCEEFPGDESETEENTLENLICRIRDLLKELGPEEYICALPEAYQWNPEIPVETDYEQFEDLYKSLSAEQNAAKRRKLCMQIISRYRRNIADALLGEEWMQPRLQQYHSVYMETVEVLAAIYKDEGSWFDLEQLCQDALIQEPLNENIRNYLIMSLEKQGKYDQALTQFVHTEKLFYRNFGFSGSDKIRRIFADGTIGTEACAADVETLMQEAGESGKPDGPFFCGYQTFCQIYQASARCIGKLGISEYLLLFTVQRQGRLWDGAVPDSALKESVAILKKILQDTLQAEDVVTQKGAAQFAVLLPACSHEAMTEMLCRIRKTFERKIRARHMELRIETGKVSAPWHDSRARAHRRQGKLECEYVETAQG